MVPYSGIKPFFGIAWKVAILAAIVIGGNYLGEWLVSQFTPVLTPESEPALHRLIMMSMAAYILFMSLPFVPGVEIGVGVLAMFGPKIAPLVYACTVVALTLSFSIGHLLPQKTIIRLLEAAHLKRAAALLHQMQPLDTDARLEFLLQRASNRIVPFLLRHRFLALMVALNLPGNAVVGGGGGICMIVGIGRLFTFPEFVITVAVAVSPVPLMVYFGLQ